MCPRGVHLSNLRILSGFQSGANAGLQATGTVTLTTYSPGGEPTEETSTPFDTLFALRNVTSDRWLTTATPSAAITDSAH